MGNIMGTTQRWRSVAAAGVCTLALLAGMHAGPSALAGNTSTSATADQRQVADVAYLASDALGGRDALTEGSRLAQEYIIDALEEIGAVGIDSAAPGRDAFRQPFDRGTNVIGVIPGTDLAHEYVIVGAHYDGQGSWCAEPGDADQICNSAQDNATGVAGVLGLGRNLVSTPDAPRRSVVLALWDAEEFGHHGSHHFVESATLPLEAITTYVNFDMLGTNLRAGARNISFVVGSETGGAWLTDRATAAMGSSSLEMQRFSLIFAQNRGDHASFVEASVPVVHFSDSPGPCYHSPEDDIDVVDFSKLAGQTAVATALVADLASSDSRPVWAPDQPIATYEDAVTLYTVASRFVGSDEFPAETHDALAHHVAVLRGIVEAGPSAFGPDSITAGFESAIFLVGLAGSGPCDGFLADDPPPAGPPPAAPVATTPRFTG